MKPISGDSRRAPDTRQSLWAIALHVLLLMATFAALIIYSVRATGWEFLLYNSDVVHPFLLARDILLSPSAVLSWNHAPSLYIVPDIVLAGVTVALQVPGLWQPVLFSSVMAALLCLGAGGVIREIAGTRILASTWAFAFALVLAGALMLLAEKTPPSGHIFLNSIVAFAHSGALTLCVWCLFLVLRMRRGPESGWQPVALVALVAAATASDMLFTVWFVAPVVVAAAFIRLLTRDDRHTRIMILVGAGTLTGLALDVAFNASRGKYLASGSWRAPWEWLQLIVTSIVEARDIAMALGLVLFMALGLHAFAIVWQALKTRQMPDRAWSILLLGLSAAAAFFAPLALNYVSDIFSLRYLLAALIMPLIWGTALLLERMPLCGPATVAVPVMLASILAALASAGKGAPIMPTTSALITCLRQEGKTTGLADFWNTMALMQASNHRLHIFPLTEVGTPYFWNTNTDWLDRMGGRPNEKPLYQFIITDRMEQSRILDRFGPPDHIKTCGESTILFYDNAITPKGVRG